MREQHLTGVEDAGSARRIDDAIAAQAARKRVVPPADSAGVDLLASERGVRAVNARVVAAAHAAAIENDGAPGHVIAPGGLCAHAEGSEMRRLAYS